MVSLFATPIKQSETWDTDAVPAVGDEVSLFGRVWIVTRRQWMGPGIVRVFMDKEGGTDVL